MVNIIFFVFLLALWPVEQTVNMEVNASSDDATQSNTGAVVITNSNAAPLRNTTGLTMWGGARFLNVQIPRGAIITSATITATDTVGGAVIDATIFMQDADNPSTFTTTTNDISNRTRTTASTEWDVASSTNGNNISPSIKSQVQTAVKRDGWNSGNAMVVILQLNTGNTAFSRSFDGNPTKAVKLNVTFTRRRSIIIF